jgi:cytochrome c oxidase cbb3-type subunit I/II
VIHTPNQEFAGDTVELVADTEDLRGLVAYLQKLGTNRGKWRDRFEPQRMEASQVSLPRSEEWIAYGKQVYVRRCLGCHGAKGDGNGPAATFMHQDRPRDFTLGVSSSASLPRDPCPTTATCCAPSPAACAAPPCRPGTNCRRRTGWR